MDYLEKHGVTERLNRIVNDMVAEKPADPYKWLAAKLGGGSSSSSMPPHPNCAPCAGSYLAPCLDPLGEAFGAHPAWHCVDATSGQRVTGLSVVNSLTGEKVPFVPRQGNRVMWYTCGPTVYDACHMGHARAYLTMDIMRRILEDYFQYEVFLQVNVTDVDDKIILRARRNKLLEMYKSEKLPLAQVRKDAAAACTAFAAKLAKKQKELEAPKETSREEDERVELLAQQQHKVQTFAKTKAKVDELLTDAACTADALVDAASEALAEALDAEKGAQVTQKEIFEAHARKYEVEWLEDMAALNIRQPDCLSRVTEYVPKIVTFVEAIIAKGLAYESNGSVYMDIAAFKTAGHAYPKLEPSKGKATEAEMAESEGTFKAGDGEKRSASDFALWKKSKAGEPAWESPWGGGRPGWHIECSVMASDIMGDNMDIHAGGNDLKFPHHDNEICQSEAFHGCAQWVNHFWHFGHLLIKGLKMSKSLKNFITIRQALEDFTARQLRLLFLLQPWDKRMDFSDQTVGEVKTKEASLKNYFDEVKAVLRDSNWQSKSTSWEKPEHQLHTSLLAHQADVHTCLCDNMNTPGAMAALLGIASDAFAYINKAKTAGARTDALLLKSGAVYVTRILRVFGVIVQEEFGFPIASGGGDYEAQVGPVLNALVKFRDDVRTAAKPLGNEAFQTMLGLCDGLRDETMVDLGVRVEDRAEGAMWKLDDPEELRKELQAKLAKQLEDKATKLLNKLNVKLEALGKAEAAATAPAAFFSLPQFAGKYGPLDADGKPSTDAAGEALSKSGLKEVSKLLDKQKKEHEKHLATLTKTPSYVEDMRAEIAEKRKELVALVEAEAANLDNGLAAQLRAALG